MIDNDPRMILSFTFLLPMLISEIIDFIDLFKTFSELLSIDFVKIPILSSTFYLKKI